jgi:3-dehydroquinate dehydratase type I
MLIAEHKALADRGAELVELRLDWLSHIPDLGRLLADRPTPVVATCRRARDKGLWRWSEEQRLMVLRSAIVSGAEYVDLEDDIAASIHRFGPTKRIVSFHDFDKTPADLEAIHARLVQHDADIVKIVTMANSQADNVRMLQLVAAAKVPTIGFCMGEYGIPSRILTGRYGAPFSYATFSKDRAMAPGQLTLEEMRDVFHYDRINAETEVFGILADPVEHSLSPLIHNAAFAHERMNRIYLPFRVPPEALFETIKKFEWLPVSGYSVTLPHKEEVIKIADRFDGPIRDIGAANTLYKGKKGLWRAANTDYDAALESLVQELVSESAPPNLPLPLGEGRTSVSSVEPGEGVAAEGMAHGSQGGPHPSPPPGGEGEASAAIGIHMAAIKSAADPALSALAGKKVLILGAGGVARAIGRGIANYGGVLMIANRTKARGAELAERLGCILTEWQNRGAVFADVLVNCTSVGMHPNLNETPFAENWLREGMVVFDTIYNPEQTLLIKQARERGCKTITGVDMFVRQAAKQFEFFTDKPAPEDVMREVIRRAISAARTV